MRNLKRLFMKNLFIRTFVVALGVIAAGAVVAWTGPTGTAPDNNAPAPINTTATTQTKTGILSSSDSFVAPNMTANQFCIGTSCVTSWGQAGGSATWASVTGKPYAFNQSADVGASPSFGNATLTNTSPTMYFVDTDNRSAMLHNNSNLLYVLRGCGNGSASWCAYNGVWPLTINLENNDMAVGGNLTVAGQSVCRADGTNCPAGAAPAWASITGKPGNLGYWDTWYGSSYHGSDGNMYLGYLGDWLSNRLNQAVTTGASPTFGTVTASAFVYSSDRRLKDNIAPIQDALAKIVELRGVNFSWTSGARAGQADVGVIAQEVQGVVPEAVRTDASGYLSVDYPKLVPLLIQAVKEQQAQIDALKADIDALRAGR